MVKRFVPVRATPDGLELMLELSTGMSGFKRLIDDDVLVSGDSDAVPQVFQLR